MATSPAPHGAGRQVKLFASHGVELLTLFAGEYVEQLGVGLLAEGLNFFNHLATLQLVLHHEFFEAGHLLRRDHLGKTPFDFGPNFFPTRTHLFMVSLAIR